MKKVLLILLACYLFTPVFVYAQPDVDQLLQEGKIDEAEELLQQRIAANKHDYVSLTELGKIYQDQGDRKRSIEILKRAVSVDPAYPMSHFYLGKAYFLAQKPSEATEEFNLFKECIKNLPEMSEDTKKIYIECMHYTCEVYFTLQKYEEMKRSIDEILSIDPSDQYAIYNSGIYYYTYEHNRSRAYSLFKKSTELDPSTSIAKRAQYAIEFMRSNPDSRIEPDFSFIDS